MTNPGAPRHFTPAPERKQLKIDLDIELPDVVALKLAIVAHEQGMTLNELAVNILEDHINGMVSPEECPHNQIEPIKAGTYVCVECKQPVEPE